MQHTESRTVRVPLLFALLASTTLSCTENTPRVDAEELAEQSDALKFGQAPGHGLPHPGQRHVQKPTNVQLGPRPYFLVESMSDSRLKRELQERFEKALAGLEA